MMCIDEMEREDIEGTEEVEEENKKEREVI
jgi:hypothetical protein